MLFLGDMMTNGDTPTTAPTASSKSLGRNFVALELNVMKNGINLSSLRQEADSLNFLNSVIPSYTFRGL